MAAILAALILGITTVTLPSAVLGETFLGNRLGAFDLLHELEMHVGRDHRMATENRVGRLEAALRPMFVAMPKDEHDRVSAASVRYLLHRLFVQRHGWFVQGIDNRGDSWNSSSPTAVFEDHAEEHRALFDDKLGRHGFGLHQVAVFAAALETLVHTESLERLETAYRMLGLSRSETLTEDEAVQAIRAYMLIYNQKPDSIALSQLTRRHFDVMDKRAGSIYSTWTETQKFAQGIRARILEDVAPDERTTWETNLRIVEEIAERHGQWQDKDCHVLKGMLMDLAMPGTGRVRLEDFWRPRLDNESWNFVESVPYLRQLGALDETDPAQMSVIITNYLTSPANCVSSSKFYSVCCIDQCERLLGSLEEAISAPYAAPAQITELISSLSSDTVQAPRPLPAALSQRLEEIAALHGGQIPLHGRLFAQWMHHAYPHECPYPHMSGTTNPLTPERWMLSENHRDQPFEVGEEEIRRVLEESMRADQAVAREPEDLLPWHAEEELFVSAPQLPAKTTTGGMLSPALMLIGAISCGVLLLNKFSTKKVSAGYSVNHKYYV